MTRKSRIAERFGAATARYDSATPVQREAARRLADRVIALPLPPRPRVLEIGCGTGHLTRLLQPAIGGHWRVSDIAPDMVAECARQCAATGIVAEFAVMDGEHPDADDQGFDLIVSSLAVQWFEDLPAALARLTQRLTPGGTLALATLGADSFAEWRAAHASLGLAAATSRYPDATQLARSFPAHLETKVTEEILSEPFAAPIEFPRRLRAIGADTPAANTRPLTPGQLRRVMKALSEQGTTTISYHLLYAVAHRSA